MFTNHEIYDTELGKIAIRYSKRASRISFKGEKGGIIAVIPSHATYSIDYLSNLIDRHREALKRLLRNSSVRNQSASLYDGKSFNITEGTILLTADSSIGRGHIRTRREPQHITFIYHPDDILSASFCSGFSRYIMRTLSQCYGSALRQMVASYASQFGLRVNGIRIGRGQRILGHCSRSGIITISAFVLLLPQHLRQYIVCHELAHLTHFDHSKAFHALCNKYCQGNEAIWSKELRNFAFPISL
ncbi:MAG: M48 family metallopeptidase [Bacteroidaceae bacterium]|nr:M48 family metallopeptidase [Bacteroidaceae bacterium]